MQWTPNSNLRFRKQHVCVCIHCTITSHILYCLTFVVIWTLYCKLGGLWRPKWHTTCGFSFLCCLALLECIAKSTDIYWCQSVCQTWLATHSISVINPCNSQKITEINGKHIQIHEKRMKPSTFHENIINQTHKSSFIIFFSKSKPILVPRILPCICV